MAIDVRPLEECLEGGKCSTLSAAYHIVTVFVIDLFFFLALGVKCSLPPHVLKDCLSPRAVVRGGTWESDCIMRALTS